VDIRSTTKAPFFLARGALLAGNLYRAQSAFVPSRSQLQMFTGYSKLLAPQAQTGPRKLGSGEGTAAAERERVA
jgi:hypothetical protein